MMFTLEVSTKVNVVLWIGDVKVTTGGVVVTRDLQVGNGIEFIDMAPEDRATIERFLAAAAAPEQGTSQINRDIVEPRTVHNTGRPPASHPPLREGGELFEIADSMSLSIVSRKRNGFFRLSKRHVISAR
jgi:hypothetical protein